MHYESHKTIVDELKKGAVPEGPPPDESCPPVTYEDDPKVGQAWQSWCSVA